MYKHSRLARLDAPKNRRVSVSSGSRSKSQPGFGGYLKPNMSASLHSFMSMNTSNRVAAASNRVAALSVPRPHREKRSAATATSSTIAETPMSYATSASSPSASPEPRFNPFAVAPSTIDGSNLTINSMDSSSVILDREGEIVSAGAEAIWRKLLPTRDYSPPRGLVFSLLLNLRSFVSPAEVMQKLIQNCIFEQNSSSANFHKRTKTKLTENILEFIDEWTSNIPYDFRAEQMRERLNELFGLCTADSNDKHRFDVLMENLLTIIHKREHYEKALRTLRQNIEDPPEKSGELCGLICLGATPQNVAQQLAQIELERLSMIGPDELVDMLSNSTLDNLQQPKDEKGQLNDIRHYIEWFNQLTHLVATEVLRHQHKRHRVKCIEFLIDLGKECMNIGNFNSLMAIVAGLTVQAVARLKRTWCRVEKSKLEILQLQLNPSGNFVSYRSTLNAAIWRWKGAKNDNEKVIIPFFGLLLKDLFFIHRGCVEPLVNGHLNLAFSENVSNLVKWKSQPCPFKRNPRILQYLLLAATYSEKNMLILSYDYEPPEHSADKDEYKKLSEESSNN